MCTVSLDWYSAGLRPVCLDIPGRGRGQTLVLNMPLVAESHYWLKMLSWLDQCAFISLKKQGTNQS